MRLLNTRTLEFCEFYTEELPKYAILSHTWEEPETRYRDFQSTSSHRRPDGQPNNPLPQGTYKIVEFCTLARRLYDCDWAWIDTCCINQESSAELSEAINSMYQWYKKAHICLVYLADYVDGTGTVAELFPHCRWFTRGWTLQELLAPTSLAFLDSKWEPISCRGPALYQAICQVTGIPYDVLGDMVQKKPVSSYSVAERMSWAAKRLTTRKEDTAYCLLGIFGITMSLQYGEGDKAFIRLQRKILKNSTDESIFAWETPSEDSAVQLGMKRSQQWVAAGDLLCLEGLLAPQPSAFLNKKQFRPVFASGPAFAITNQGVEFHVFNKVHLQKRSQYSDVIFPLNCVDARGSYLAVTLACVEGRWYRKSSVLMHLGRPDWDEFRCFDDDFMDWQTLYVQAFRPPFFKRLPEVQLIDRHKPVVVRFHKQVMPVSKIVRDWELGVSRDGLSQASP